MFEVRVAAGANLISFKRRSLTLYDHSSSQRGRGPVRGFSRRSRRRLMNLLASIPSHLFKSAIWVDLTYPSEFPDARRAKEHLASFIKRIRRRWPRATIIWKLEFQKRGAPHFHLIIFNIPFLPHDWVARAWYEIVGSGDPSHLQAGTSVRRIISFRRAMAYASKYIAKPVVVDGDVGVGRFWGVYGRAFLPVVFVSFLLTEKQFYDFKRYIRNYLSSQLRRYRFLDFLLRSRFSSFSIYLPYSVAIRMISCLE